MFYGTDEQLQNALRETERRGGQVGAIAGAAADEIEHLRDEVSKLRACTETLRGKAREVLGHQPQSK